MSRAADPPVDPGTVQAYWRSPDDGQNAADAYVDPLSPKLATRSRALVDLISRHATTKDSVLELGCNAGRNLQFLYEAGFNRLSGIEISADALALLHRTFPQLGREATFYPGAVETVIDDLPSEGFDLVFTMAVLIHIHPDSDWAIKRLAALARRRLIIVEHEADLPSWRHFRRDYRAFFEAQGWREIETLHPFPGLPASYLARVFERADQAVG